MLRHQSKQKFPRGLGRTALCAGCNGGTAANYGIAFAEWTAKAMEYLERVDSGGRLVLPFTIRPLYVWKQIATMALAMAGEYTIGLPKFDQLRRLVLNPRVSAPTHGLRFHTYMAAFDSEPRLTTMAVPADVIRSGLKPFVWCEVALSPLGYVVMNDGPDEEAVARAIGLQDITMFQLFDYREIRTVHLGLRVRQPNGAAPLQYKGIKS